MGSLIPFDIHAATLQFYLYPSYLSAPYLLYHFSCSVTETYPAVAKEHHRKSASYATEGQQQQPGPATTSSPHAFRLIVRQEQTTAVSDVACQCDDDDYDNDDEDGGGVGGSNVCGCSANDELLDSAPSSNFPFKISTTRKRYVG